LILFLRPVSGIKKILDEKPGMRLILYWLFIAGLLRGVVETIWLYLMKGQFHQFVSSMGDLNWYLLNIGPFIVSNISSSYFLWTLTALIVYEAGKFLDGNGNFVDILRIYGVAMFSYFLIGILNFFHYFVNISMIRFRASEIFNPDMGIGQIAIFVWLAILTYQVARNIHPCRIFIDSHASNFGGTCSVYFFDNCFF
jgi:hypothetical protein